MIKKYVLFASSLMWCGGLLTSCGTEPSSSDDDVIVIAGECTRDAECADSSTGPVCDLSTLTCKAGCLNDSDCDGEEKTVCDTSTNACVAPEPEGCAADADCQNDGEVCEVATGACVPFTCEADTDCEAPTPVCEVATGACVAGCVTDADCVDAALPQCNVDAHECEAAPVATLIGTGDGSVESVNFATIYTPPTPIESTDLGFHPERDELWVLHREFEVSGECTEANPSSARCNSLWGSTTIISLPGSPLQREDRRMDANAWHFMRRPTSMAMGVGEMFSTCAEAATGNFEDNDVNFIGPTLWSTDLDIYARPSGGNGSHMDMLHATPWCMGIAHERDNVYWVLNGDAGSIDRYNFNMDHGPGADDHADGEIWRYVPGELSRVANVPSHMEYHEADEHLYVVDTGNARLIKLDTTQGTLGSPFTPVYEPLMSYGFMNDTAMTEVIVDQGLVQPSGLAIYENTLYVGDHATGMIHAFDMDGQKLRALQTPLGEGALAGLEVGPKGKLWFTDMKSGAVYRIDP